MSEENPKTKEKIAVIRIRGPVRVKGEINDTMKMLRLHRKNVCSIYEKTPSISGMLIKAKDYITWGEINDETLKLLIEKRGEKDPKDKNKLKPFFRLHPPKGGFEKAGIKKPFTVKGALGYRGDKINDLIKKML